MTTYKNIHFRFNQKKKQVELRASKACTEISALQKGVDFVTAFTYGFDIDDALALVRLALFRPSCRVPSRFFVPRHRAAAMRALRSPLAIS